MLRNMDLDVMLQAMMFKSTRLERQVVRAHETQMHLTNRQILLLQIQHYIYLIFWNCKLQQNLETNNLSFNSRSNVYHIGQETIEHNLFS